MFKFILPASLIGLAIGAFFVFIEPFYKEVVSLKEQTKSFNQALDNSKALEAARDELTQKYNSIDPENIRKIEKLLPDNVDNIRLILEIEKIASPYGMILKDVKYDATKKVDVSKKDANTAVVLGGATSADLNREYGTLELEFSTEGIYSDFVSFVKDIENNLRIVDISSVDFTAEESSKKNKSNQNLSDSYKYTFKIKTYWLKN